MSIFFIGSIASKARSRRGPTGRNRRGQRAWRDLKIRGRNAFADAVGCPS